MTARPPRQLPQNFIGDFFRGIGYPLEAFGFIRSHGLWRMAAVPALINTILFALTVFLVFWFVIPEIQSLEQVFQPSNPDDGWWSSVLSGLGKAAYWVVFVLAVIATPVLSAVFILLIGQAVASPFLDLLSEKVENIVLGTTAIPNTASRTVRSVVVAVADIVWTLLFWLAVNMPLLLVNLIPVLGTAVNAALGFSFTALLLSQEFVGLSMSRQLVSYPARWRVVWANRWLCVGNGCTTLLLFLVPGLNLLLLPLAAVGGTLLYCDLQAAGRINAPVPAPLEE
ncbi:MAG: hypothetical protein A2289_15745 [Deltaproteobacteria bacterium RIFOXYA12_FULL_58_15]|nr:MAG: hypothetical protein A2289_15745 [Deltaproteobacteria bacterium RIFOXYA12_FULL_58_15]OGR10372.1 MAG: hypothetical protein A2341_22920 [Deltaproteobacteria bacterium RIFOXYB12_FULL_58_9]